MILGAHVVVRVTAPYADPVLLPLVAALNGLGLAVIHRLDLAAGAGKEEGFARQQLTWMTLGVLLFAGTLVFLRDYRVLQRFTYTFGLAAIVLLLLPMLPGIGKDINGARIWIHVGPFSFQPGEVAKVLLVVAFAGYLVRHRDALALAGRRVLFVDLPRGRDLGPILVMWLISLAILVFQRDLGSSLLFFGLFLVMLYVATERPGLAAWSAARCSPSAPTWATAPSTTSPRASTSGSTRSPTTATAPTTAAGRPWRRCSAWPGAGCSAAASATGSPGGSPTPSPTSSWRAIGEELGLTAVMAVILCYGLIVERGLRTALICRDTFGKLIATGLACVFALQVFVVIGGVTRLIPLTGLTTPFLSYGGSSLVANWVIIALLLRISDHARRPVPVLDPASEPPADEEATQVVKLS